MTDDKKPLPPSSGVTPAELPPLEQALEMPPPQPEGAPPMQWGSGVGEARDQIYARAAEIVEAAKAEAASLDVARVDDWPALRDLMRKTALALGDDCFHDGALGPGTAMLTPAPYLEALRALFQFSEATYTLPLGWGAQLKTMARLDARLGGAADGLVARIPGRWAQRGSVDALVFALERQSPFSAIEVTLETLPPDVEKWVGAAVYRVQSEGTTLTVIGPPSLHEIVKAFFGD